ncbi:hypothetical protein MRX96_030198 [Rhipicephalus microplus]
MFYSGNSADGARASAGRSPSPPSLVLFQPIFNYRVPLKYRSSSEALGEMLLLSMPLLGNFNPRRASLFSPPSTHQIVALVIEERGTSRGIPWHRLPFPVRETHPAVADGHFQLGSRIGLMRVPTPTRERGKGLGDTNQCLAFCVNDGRP